MLRITFRERMRWHLKKKALLLTMTENHQNTGSVAEACLRGYANKLSSSGCLLLSEQLLHEDRELLN